MDYTTQNIFSLTASASDGIYLANTRVNIHVTDINEKPTISQSYYRLPVSETTKIKTDLLQIIASDPDIGQNGTLYFSIIDPVDDTFAVNVSTGMLYLNSALVYYKKNAYLISVDVYDHGGLHAKEKVTINISVFTKSNIPNFKNDTYSVTINERNPFNLNVKATRPNVDDILIFSMSNEAITQAYFKIHPKTGAIENIRDLDYEVVQMISFSIYAAVSNDVSQVGCARVEVKLEDINDNAPVIMNKTISLHVNEDLLIGSLIFNLHGVATDKDSSSNGNIVYYINGGNTKDTFVINSKQQLILSKQLDYESQNAFEIIIIASDGKLTSHDNISIYLLIEDVNEHNPVFKKSYVFSVDENKNVSFKVTADDSDIKNTIRYEIVNDFAKSYFTIHSQSGVIQSTKALDYEVNKNFVFQVDAFDNGINFRHGFTIVNITIKDQNDNFPHFAQKLYVRNVSEAYPINTEILKVQAVDIDSNVNGEVYYYLIDSTFTIGKYSGIISLLHPLDFEHIKSHNLTVYAFDRNILNFLTVYLHGKDFSNFSTTAVNINVIDENEYNPEFKQLVYNITVTENAIVSDTLKALDKDTADRIQYRIIDPTVREKFEVNVNGLLRNIAVLDFE